MDEFVLVDSNPRPIGVMFKVEVHLDGGSLYRVLSVFVSNDKGDLLLQRRAAGEYHSGGLRSNTCRTQTRPGETTICAARRRLTEEMVVTRNLSSFFVSEYAAACSSGLTEKEVDHVFFGRCSEVLDPDPSEVSDCRWVQPGRLVDEIREAPEAFTPWLRLALPRVMVNMNHGSKSEEMTAPFPFEAAKDN
jgi:isopentenyl-diphosphate delta-isomerase